jgi:putative ABC transport system permease protein
MIASRHFLKRHLRLLCYFATIDSWHSPWSPGAKCNAMLRYYFVIAFRNLMRNRSFSIVNIAGLSVGMAVCIMLAQYVTFEQSFDRFHDKHENIYRMVNVRYFPAVIDESAGCVTALGPAMEEMFPEVISYTRFYKTDRVFSADDADPVRFSNVFSVDSTFLDIFSFDVVRGGRQSLLSKPNTAVLSESASKALFADRDPVGETVLLGGQTPYLVEAVIADPPTNSHIQFEILVSLVTDFNDPNYCWTCNNRNTYILLAPGTNVAAFESKLQHVVQKVHMGETLKREYKIQPLTSIHLHSKLRFEHGENGNANAVMAFTIIAGLILFIAWLNYINLTTSMAMSRSNEVAIRKINGSSRRNLVGQFLFESFIVNLIALASALALAVAMFPSLGTLLEVSPSLTLLGNPVFWLCVIGILVLGSIACGFYPAFVLSSFKPLQSVKGNSLLPPGVNVLKRSLVFIQFSISIVLIAGTMTVYRQIAFMKSMDLGLNMEQTLVVPVPPEFRQHEDGFGEAMRNHTAIRGVTHTSDIPGNEVSSVGGGYKPEGVSSDVGHQVYSFWIARNYFQYFSIEFLAGANFESEQSHNDANTEIIINDAARKAFGFNSPEEALGKIIHQNENIKGRVIGVVKDYHQRSPDHPIPLSVFQVTRGKGYYLVRLSSEAITDGIRVAEQAFRESFPNNPFEYFFLDDHFNTQYRSFTRFGKVFSLFTLLAIFISCLGLFGLTLHVMSCRKREIAIRKVLGASVPRLLTLMSGEYIKLLIAAFFLAAPLAWLGIGKWLESFPFQVEMHWSMLLIPGLIVMMVAWVTITGQILKAILTNPAEILKKD